MNLVPSWIIGYTIALMDEIQFPIMTISGIGTRMGAMILAEIGGFSCFDSANKILASPSTYPSGQLTGCHAHMEKHGYLRCAIFNAAKYVCN